MKDSVLFSLTFMLIGIFCFGALPKTLLRLFSNEADVFQAIGNAKASALLSLIRQLGCLIPIFWAFSKLGLVYT